MQLSYKIDKIRNILATVTPAAAPGVIGDKNNLSFRCFIDKFLKHYFSIEGCSMHDDIIQLCQDINERSVVIAAPRGFAKSTIVSFAFPLWAICEKLYKFIVIVSDTTSQAEGFLRDIVSELEDNDELTSFYGEHIMPKKDRSNNYIKYTDRDIILNSGCRVAARGSDTKMRGLRMKEHRPDLIICDDIENDQHVLTLDQRGKLLNWFNKALVNTLDPDTGRLFIIGTILHHDSLLKNLYKNETYTSKLYTAINAEGNALWPAKWSLSKLADKKKQIGSIAFQSEFMNQPLNLETKIFKEDWLKYYNPNDISKVGTEFYVRDEKLTLFGGIDPAISQSSKADYFAFITLGITKNKDIYILEAFKERLNFTSQVRTILSKADKYNHNEIAIEENGYQSSLKEQLLSQELLRIKPVKNKKDKYSRIISLSTYFENGKIYMQKNMQNLIEELLYYPEVAHDDLLDALEMTIDISKTNDIDYKVFRCFESEPISRVW